MTLKAILWETACALWFSKVSCSQANVKIKKSIQRTGLSHETIDHRKWSDLSCLTQKVMNMSRLRRQWIGT